MTSGIKPVIALASLDRGVGRTTLAAALASFFIERGATVAMADYEGLERLQALVERKAGTPGWDRVILSKKRPSVLLEKDAADVVLIDGPNLNWNLADKVLSECGLLLLVARPDEGHLLGLNHILPMLRQVREEQPDLAIAGLVLCRFMPMHGEHSRVERLAREHLKLPCNATLPEDPSLQGWIDNAQGILPGGPGRALLCMLDANIRRLLEPTPVIQ
jgi:cellulose biosynthesis protein BcsQ